MSTTEATVTNQLLDQWATDMNGPVALHLKQKLLPVEGEGGVIFPPTYADIGYNIDTLSDGTKVATIDSVGSQANRMEPMFKCTKDESGKELNPLSELVPQIEIILSVKEKDGEKYERRQSLLDLAHRSADAVVKATPELRKFIDPAFVALNRHCNARPLCAVAPTSLLFGIWDSRDGTGEKRPRLVRSIIRAWDVDVLHSAAQFNSVWKELSNEQKEELEKDAKSKKTKLSKKGFADAPAVFRKVSQNAAKHMLEFQHGSPNPERRTLGGVLAKGAIERSVTINLVALRALRGGSDEETKQVRKYLLYLALLAATAELDLFLREGCLLRYADKEDVWMQVPRRGEPSQIKVPGHNELVRLAKQAADPFKKEWPKDDKGQAALEYNFNIKKAKELLSKHVEEEAAES